MATADDADTWWFAQPPERRTQIHRWVAGRDALDHPPVEGQLEIPLPRRHRSPQNRS